jgi:putative ABC transport system permease protein
LLWGAKSEQVRRGLSGPDLDDIRSESRIFDGISGFIGTYGALKIDGDDSPAVNAAYVDPGIFSVLRVQPLRGRAFLPGEDEPGHDKVAVLSYGLWASRYAGNAEILGRTIRLDGEPYVVVGVMPPQFFFPELDSQLWLPLSPSKWDKLAVRGFALVQAVGRLKGGATLAQARADVDTITRRLQSAYPATDKDLSIGLFSLYRIVVGKYYAALWTLLAAVGFVLLIACANVANLLLARAVERDKELAVRAALGASRLDILGHLLTESVMLALLGGVGGGLLAYWGIRFVRGLGLTDIPRIGTTGLNLHVLAFTVATSLLTVLVFGLGPAVLASRANLSEPLTRGGATTRGAGRSELSDLLVVGEVALALVLLMGAGLLVKSFARLVRSDWGFRPHNLLEASVQLPGSSTSSPSRQAEYTQQVLGRLKVLPGVESAAMSTCVPLDRGSGWMPTGLAVDGRIVRKGWETYAAGAWIVGPGYFRTLGVPVLRGREFADQDGRPGPPVVVISKALADKFWRGVDPVGRQLQLAHLHLRDREGREVERAGKPFRPDHLAEECPACKLEYEVDPGPPLVVVGVVGNVRMFGLDVEVPPALYLSVTGYQYELGGIKFVVRTSADPLRLAAAVRGQIMEVDRGAGIGQLTTMEELVRRSIGGRGSNKILVVISVMFGSLGLLLATGGVYGVLSYVVSQRTQEFGVRMALGAARGDIIWLVMGHGSRLIVSGTALGMAGAWALTRLLSNFLFGVKPTDPATFALVVPLLGAAALLACLVPTRRATRTDPARSLRYE